MFVALAQIAPLHDADPGGEAWFFYLFVGSLVVILTLYALANSLRRKPPIEAEFATKKEVAEAIARVDGDLKHLDRRNEELANQIFGEIKSMGQSINHEFSSLNRAVGRLEGHQELAKCIAEAIKSK